MHSIEDPELQSNISLCPLQGVCFMLQKIPFTSTASNHVESTEKAYSICSAHLMLTIWWSDLDFSRLFSVRWFIVVWIRWISLSNFPRFELYHQRIAHSLLTITISLLYLHRSSRLASSRLPDAVAFVAILFADLFPLSFAWRLDEMLFSPFSRWFQLAISPFNLIICSNESRLHLFQLLLSYIDWKASQKTECGVANLWDSQHFVVVFISALKPKKMKWLLSQDLYTQLK